MGNPASRAVIFRRWDVWKRFISEWLDDITEGREETLRILDAGCGDGINLRGVSTVFEQLDRSFRLFGMDYNVTRARKAKGLADGIFVGDMLSPPLKKEKFDIILCNHVLEHIPDDVKALKELRNLLSSSGLLVLGVPNEGCVLARLRNHFVQPSIAKTTDHVHFYTWKTLSKRLQLSGWRIVFREVSGFFMPHTGLHRWVAGANWGRKLVFILGRIFRSQCGELMVGCEKLIE